ncbi:related to SOH1 protein [Fusarium fujikuroi IMI 58289]|uniref:Mediator of RNA polymerase II transcription subunit 31 n=1 Tax=Gibberella fujikuroi (strain CBS 195.34 / IMI 58289 / NRRL A-6831) TaxID=1279085 RepID=S0E561_GIBF5|nr:related to SOH1 protein [Fusarium fujikuroi IMI 58289]KLO83387.1 SOH1 protein [Fusarium fujikuroi]KLO84272.1 SOH1 protein [Fusarium fujikuroi]KLP16801.1 SOH1 protein [Fusarium fujikuroi]CCT70014.1 related to SOH1 protein [Fusarium fujikuroi IMI 58289]
MATGDSQDIPMGSPPEPPAEVDREPKYGGYSRFEVELEFVQSLANPAYLNHLASQKLLSQPAFVAYLGYLQYWSKPPYLKYLTYPGPTLRHLELLQQETFRQQIISPDVVRALMEEGMKASDDTKGTSNNKRNQDEAVNESMPDTPRKRKTPRKKKKHSAIKDSATPVGTDS